MTGLPLPERVVRRRNARNVSAGVESVRTDAWRVQLAKVSSCVKYDGGKGLMTDIEFSDEQPERRWVLECEFTKAGDDVVFYCATSKFKCVVFVRDRIA